MGFLVTLRVAVFRRVTVVDVSDLGAWSRLQVSMDITFEYQCLGGRQRQGHVVKDMSRTCRQGPLSKTVVEDSSQRQLSKTAVEDSCQRQLMSLGKQQQDKTAVPDANPVDVLD